MDASVDRGSPLALRGPGRFTRVAIQTSAGEIEAKLSEAGNWELRLRREGEDVWRVACRGDLEAGAITAEPARRDMFVRGRLVVDPDSMRATVDRVALKLTPKEFALLSALAASPDRVFTEEELKGIVWGEPRFVSSRSLRSHVSKVRQKIRAAGVEGMIVNCWGVGYRLWDLGGLDSIPSSSQAGAPA